MTEPIPDNALVSYRQLPPLIVTFEQLQRAVAPVIGADAWAGDTIGDLWRMGAPDPQDGTRRILFPGQLATWLADVLTRQGKPLDVAALAYVEMLKRG